MLKTEWDDPRIEAEVLEVAKVHPETWTHGFFTVVYEHGQWWLTCGSCGAQWWVCDATGGRSVSGFDFEEVTPGDDEAEHPEAK